MKIKAQTVELNGKQVSGLFVIPSTDSERATVNLLSRSFTTLPAANNSVFIPNESRTAVEAAILRHSGTPVAIDITDPQLDVPGGGLLNATVSEMLGRGDRRRRAQELWEVYRSLCRARQDGKDASAPVAEQFVALVGAGKSVKDIRDFIDAQL